MALDSRGRMSSGYEASRSRSTRPRSRAESARGDRWRLDDVSRMADPVQGESGSA